MNNLIFQCYTKHNEGLLQVKITNNNELLYDGEFEKIQLEQVKANILKMDN